MLWRIRRCEERFNDWGGRGYEDFVPGKVTKTAPFGNRTTRFPTWSASLRQIHRIWPGGWSIMSPVGAVFVPFPPKTGIKLLHPPPPPQSLNGSELVSDAMRVKHLLKLTLKFASLVSSNGADLQPSRGDVLGDDISWRGGGIALLLQKPDDLEPREVVLYIITYLLHPRLVACMLPPRSTKKRPALRVERVFVDFSTALRRAFALEQATHGVHVPDSSTTSFFAVSRVICSLGWPSSWCISITPRDSNALDDYALFSVLLQRRPITSNKPDFPRRKVHMVFFPRPSCALFG